MERASLQAAFTPIIVRCIISQTKFGYVTVIRELLCWFSCCLSTRLCCAGASAPRWTLRLCDYASPSLGNVVAELKPVPFSLTASVNQHTYQGHLACLSCCFTSTWTLLRPRSALPAGERQGISNVVQTCTHTYACPRPKSSLPAGLRLENTLWDAKRDCRITGLCGTTGD